MNMLDYDNIWLYYSIILFEMHNTTYCCIMHAVSYMQLLRISKHFVFCSHLLHVEILPITLWRLAVFQVF